MQPGRLTRTDGSALGGRAVRAGGPAGLTSNLAVAAGEWVMLIGRNGAGKTSLLRAVAGLVHYDGSVTVGGREVASLGPRQRARGLAMVPQTPVVPLDMTVADYALLGRTPAPGVPRPARPARLRGRRPRAGQPRPRCDGGPEAGHAQRW